MSSHASLGFAHLNLLLDLLYCLFSILYFDCKEFEFQLFQLYVKILLGDDFTGAVTFMLWLNMTDLQRFSDWLLENINLRSLDCINIAQSATCGCGVGSDLTCFKYLLSRNPIWKYTKHNPQAINDEINSFYLIFGDQIWQSKNYEILMKM